MYTLEQHMASRDASNRAAVRARIAARGPNFDALAFVNEALAVQAEQQRWFDAGLLAAFRNWRNRR